MWHTGSNVSDEDKEESWHTGKIVEGEGREELLKVKAERNCAIIQKAVIKMKLERNHGIQEAM